MLSLRNDNSHPAKLEIMEYLISGIFFSFFSVLIYVVYVASLKWRRRIIQVEINVIELKNQMYRLYEPLIPSGTKLIVTNGHKFLVEVVECSHGYYNVWEGQNVPIEYTSVTKEKTYRRRLLLKFLDGSTKPYFGNCIEIYNPEMHKEFI